MKTKYILTIITLLWGVINASATSYTWNGSVSTSYSNNNNWTPSGIPDSADKVTVNSGTYNLVLDQNRKVTNLTLSSKTIDLSTYTLTVYGTATMTSGTVTNGTFKCRGTLAAFNGTLMDCPVDAVCGSIRLSGSTFNEVADFTDLGTATGTGSGGCTFNDDVTITHSGTLTYFTLGNTIGDVFNANVTFTNNSNRELYISTNGSTTFNGNVICNSTSTGGILFGNSGGTSTLASGKTISIGGSGFAADYLTLKNFTQSGTTAQTLTLTGTAIVNMISCTFNGNLTVTAPGFLLKNNTFNGTATLTRNGSSGNHQSDGGNTFNSSVLADNSGSSGRIRWASTTGDFFNGNATFNSSGNQDVQIAYAGTSEFKSNITINSNKVVFNTASGKVTFSGSNNQTLNGSYNFPFKKLAINKSSGTVTANTTLSVDDTLFFVSGKLITTSTNLLTMKAGSVASGASNSSFVSGPIKKTGNTAFQFPVGKNSVFRKVEITAPSNATDAFTAEYFDTSQTSGSIMDTTITFISDCGYWSLTRNTGSTNITPKFAFDSTHCGYLTVKPVHIAFWNGAKWVDKGEGVNDGNTKKTSAAVTSYGNFALAYKLMPGDAPQYPYPLTMDTQCNATELLFTSDDIWFSFTPDSALIKARFQSPDEDKIYAVIKNATIFHAYSPFDVLDTVSTKSWEVDSMLESSLIYVDSLTPSTNYLLKVTKFNSSEGEGIYDTTDYYFNICMLNLRMSLAADLIHYTQLNFLNQLQLAGPKDILYPIGEFTFDLTAHPGLDIEPGVTLVGNYDLLSEPFEISVGGPPLQIQTSPQGTRFISNHRDAASLTSTNASPYMFVMSANSTIRNIRLQGAMTGFQDYNQDDLLCSGIKVDKASDPNPGQFTISHCEIYNFSYAGIFLRANSSDLTINNCYIHHIKGAGGHTPPKGYGTWIQGATSGGLINTLSPTQCTIINCYFDECKEALDLQPNPSNVTVDSCSFGQIFGNENINKHGYGGNTCLNCIYNHPDPNQGSCVYFSDHDPCVSVSTDDPYDIAGPGAGNTIITNSVFHQNANNISIPYPANTKAEATVPANGVGIPLYNIKVNFNTFATNQTVPNTSDCYYNGYARINDNHLDACTWDYEKTHNINHQFLLTLPVGNDPNPIIESTLNSFSYTPGSIATNTMSPQPPEIDIAFDATNEVRGFSPSQPAIPVYAQNDPIEIEVSHGTVGNQSTNVTYVVQAKVSEGNPVDANNSANNAYNSNQVITEPQSINQTFDEGDFFWDTNKPGLFGIDAFSVDGNYSSTACSPYYASKVIHKPVIIVPDMEYMLIFNIKDSYYSNLYTGSPIITKVLKRVALNGFTIWEEDIGEGGDDWERVEIDLDAANYLQYLNTDNFKNTLTFSIIMTDPSDVNTSGSVDVVKGVNVWVDDVYLKKYQSAENLILDGDVESSTGSELTDKPEQDRPWYYMNKVTFEAYHLNLYTTTSCTSSLYATTKASLNSWERKSGMKAIMLNLPPLKPVGSCSTTNYGVTAYGVGDEGEYISAAVDFDVRDFLSCDHVADLMGYNEITTSSLTDPVTNENFLINSDIVLTSNLTITSSNLLFAPHTPPYTITVPDTYTLTIIGNPGSPAPIADSTYLSGCKQTWGGIIVEPGGILNVDGYVSASEVKFVTIEDAQIAVNAQGDGAATSKEPTITLNHIGFNKNVVALQVENDDYIDSEIIECLFKCDGGYISKDPSATFMFPEKHVYLNNAQNLHFVDQGGLTQFKDAYIGIMANQSDVLIDGGEFFDLINNASLPIKGIGVYAINYDPIPEDIDISSRFRNLYRGISVIGNYNIDIHDNDYFRDIDLIGITIRSLNFNNDIEISGVNNFLRNNIGINISGTNLNSVNISNNIFTNTAFVETSTNAFHNTAIVISGSQSTTSQVELDGNTITNYRIGMAVNRVPRIKIGSNSPNSFTFNLGDLTTNPEYHAGIWLRNCNEAEIYGGFVHHDITNSSESTGSGILDFRGIDIENSINCRINCMDIYNIPMSIYFTGDCNFTKMRLNHFENYENAVVLHNDQTILPPQGEVPLTSMYFVPYDNEWADSTVPEDFRTYRFNSILPNNIDWYYDNVTNTTLHFPEPTNTVLSQPLNIDCDCNCSTNTRLTDRDKSIGYIINDSLSFSSNGNEFTYQAKMNVFLAMKADSTLIYQGTPNDSVYLNFYNAMKSSNMNRLDSVSILSVQTLTTQAINLNDDITDTNFVEYYMKITSSIYLNGPFQGIDLTYTDSTVLEEIAMLPVSLAGNAVYAAAAMLGLEVHQPSEGEARMSKTDVISLEKIKPKEMLVYPNPSNEKVFFDFKQIDLNIQNKLRIFDGQGKLIMEQRMTESIFEFKVSKIEPGIYRFIFLNDNDYIAKGNFAVMH